MTVITCVCVYVAGRGLLGLSFITLNVASGGWDWNWTAKVIMQRLGCKSLNVCVCSLLYVCGCRCFHLCVCVLSCVCECPLTPERLSSLSSEATGVQRVCFHTPLLRYNGSHFFLPPFHLAPFVLPHLSFSLSPFFLIRSWNISLPPLYCLLPTPLYILLILTPFLHSIPAVLKCVSTAWYDST